MNTTLHVYYSKLGAYYHLIWDLSSLTFSMGEVTFFVLNKSSDFWLIGCQCNPKTLVKSAVSQGTVSATFY